MLKWLRMAYDNMWKCDCGAWNPDSANVCGRCGKQPPDLIC